MADLSSFTSILELNIAFNSAFILIASRKNSIYRNILPHFSEKISKIKKDSDKMLESIFRSVNEIKNYSTEVAKLNKKSNKLIIHRAKVIIENCEQLQENIKTETNINERTESKSNFFSHICFHLATYSLLLLFINPYSTKQFFLLLNCLLTIITLIVSIVVIIIDTNYLKEKYPQSSAIQFSISILAGNLFISFLVSTILHNFTEFSIFLQCFFLKNQFVHNTLLFINLTMSILHFIIYFAFHFRTINKFILSSEKCIQKTKSEFEKHQTEMEIIITDSSLLIKKSIIAELGVNKDV